MVRLDMKKALYITLLVVCVLLLGWSLVSADSSGPNNPDVGADDATVGTLTWGTTTNLTASDNSYDANGGSGITHYLIGTDFDFALPANSTVLGVEVGIEGKTGFESSAQDNSVKLVVGGVVSGDDKSIGTAWTSSDATHSFGGTSDTWGLSLTDSDVNALDFGVAYSCNITGNGIGADCYVDTMTITLTYSVGVAATSRGFFVTDGSVKVTNGSIKITL